VKSPSALNTCYVRVVRSDQKHSAGWAVEWIGFSSAYCFSLFIIIKPEVICYLWNNPIGYGLDGRIIVKILVPIHVCYASLNLQTNDCIIYLCDELSCPFSTNIPFNLRILKNYDYNIIFETNDCDTTGSQKKNIHLDKICSVDIPSSLISCGWRSTTSAARGALRRVDPLGDQYTARGRGAPDKGLEQGTQVAWFALASLCFEFCVCD